jgi:O-acetyl-ADP-ribose deacetylase (regulator of RNase III)
MEGIIHVASMGRHGEQDLNIVRECLTAALDLATEKGYGSVGTAAFGSGINMIKLSEWLSDFGHTMVKYLSEAAVLDDKPARDLSVVLVLFEPDNFNQALATLESAIREAWYEVDRRGTPVVASRDPAASPPVAK